MNCQPNAAALVTAPYALQPDEIVVDNFAGGGGASTGMELGLGCHVDIAINHDADAIEMHKLNHPESEHYCESVWDVDPVAACRGRPVGLGWFSPDCKHFSKAKGAIPVDKNIRGLAWVAVRWAALVPMRVLMLENVEEFQTWGPLGPDNRPCTERKGETFEAFKLALSTGLPVGHPGYKDIYQALLRCNYNLAEKLTLYKRIKQGLGYQVEHRILKACDFGAPTIRQRLFLVARNDGHPIQWPAPTHGPQGSGLAPYRTAADIIDWSIPCKSIFGRKRPLAENTLKRIARGIDRFVLNHPAPFIVRIGQTGFGGDGMQYPLTQPLTTITSKAEHLLVTPMISRQFGKSVGHGAEEPLGTVTCGGGGKSALVAAFLAKHFGGVTGTTVDKPLPTVTAKGCQTQLVTSSLIKLRGTCQDGQPVDEPMPTITAGGNHVGEVRAFLIKYYGVGDGHAANEPLHTITTKDRFGLVTIEGEDYQIVDIGMRMLEPHELFAANGFPLTYQFSHDRSGKPIPKYKQVARCGNAVPPQFPEALVKANFGPTQPRRMAA